MDTWFLPDHQLEIRVSVCGTHKIQDGTRPEHLHWFTKTLPARPVTRGQLWPRGGWWWDKLLRQPKSRNLHHSQPHQVNAKTSSLRSFMDWNPQQGSGSWWCLGKWDQTGEARREIPAGWVKAPHISLCLNRYFCFQLHLILQNAPAAPEVSSALSLPPLPFSRDHSEEKHSHERVSKTRFTDWGSS